MLKKEEKDTQMETTGTQRIDPFKEISKALKSPELKTRILPHANRLLCIALEQEVQKLESGIILPNQVSGMKSGDIKKQVRYIIAALGDNVKELKFDGKKAEVGDEMVFCDIPDAVRVEVPTVFDYELLDRMRRRRIFVSFDIAEIHGIIKH